MNEIELLGASKILTAKDVEYIDNQIENLINVKEMSRTELNKLTFECIANLTNAENKKYELENKGFLKRFVGGITGSNRKLEDEIRENQIAAQYASEKTLKKLAEENALTFDLLISVNNKLNASILRLNNDIKNIYSGLLNYVKYNQSELVKQSLRIEALEQNVNLLNWQAAIEYQLFDNVEYAELSPLAKLVCLANDFYEITKGKWDTKDLLLLKTAMANIGILPNSTMNFLEVVLELSKNKKLLDRLFGVNYQLNNASCSNLLLLGSLEKLGKLDADERYIVETVKEYTPDKSYEDIRKDVFCKYMLNNYSMDLDFDIKNFELLLDFIYNLNQGFEENHILVNLKPDVNEIAYDGENNYLDLIQKMTTDELLIFQGKPPAEYVRSMNYYEYNLENFEIFNDLSRSGSIDAKRVLAFFYTEGKVVEADKEIAKKLKKELAEAGDPWGMYKYGWILTDENVEDGIAMVKKAAELGVAEAAVSLAKAYITGNSGVTRNEEEANYWAEKAIELGVHSVCYRMYCCLSDEESDYRDDKKAIEWLKRGDKFEDPDCMSRYAKIKFDKLTDDEWIEMLEPLIVSCKAEGMGSGVAGWDALGMNARLSGIMIHKMISALG